MGLVCWSIAYACMDGKQNILMGEKRKLIIDDLVLGMTVKTLIAITLTVATTVGMYYNLQSQINEAKELPKSKPSDVSIMEYEMKDQLVRQTIMNTQDDVSE